MILAARIDSVGYPNTHLDLHICMDINALCLHLDISSKKVHLIDFGTFELSHFHCHNKSTVLLKEQKVMTSQKVVNNPLSNVSC